MDIVNKYIASVVQWFKDLNLTGMIMTVVVGIVIYKLIPPIISWLVYHLAKGVKVSGGKKEARIEKKKRLKTLTDLFTGIFQVIVVATVVYTILTDIGINLGPLLASAGIAGVALGFGAQSMVKDMLAGFFIIMENQYRVGDYVSISGVGVPTDAAGVVEKVGLRSTTIRDRGGNVHVVSNGTIVEVTNKTKGYSKVRFSIAVTSDTDTEKLIKVINETGQELARDPKWDDEIVDAPHYAGVGTISKDGFNVTISGITQPAAQWDVSSEYRRRLVIALRKHDINTTDVADA